MPAKKGACNFAHACNGGANFVVERGIARSLLLRKASDPHLSLVHRRRERARGSKQLRLCRKRFCMNQQVTNVRTEPGHRLLELNRETRIADWPAGAVSRPAMDHVDTHSPPPPGATHATLCPPPRRRPHLSLLTFRGHMAVHGLFDFLLEACGHPMGRGGGGGGIAGGGAASGRGAGGRIGAGGDVPLLLSRQPFLNASLKALKV